VVRSCLVKRENYIEKCTIQVPEKRRKGKPKRFMNGIKEDMKVAGVK